MVGEASSRESRTVNHQYFIRAPPEQTFDAISNPAMIVKWLSDRAELSLQTGGRYLLGWTDGPTHSGTIVEFEPGKSLAMEWEWPGISLQGTVFRLRVEAKDEGSLLIVEHSGFPKREEWADLYGGAEWGWTYFVMNLKSILETGRDLRSKYDG